VSEGVSETESRITFVLTVDVMVVPKIART